VHEERNVNGSKGRSLRKWKYERARVTDEKAKREKIGEGIYTQCRHIIELPQLAINTFKELLL